MTSIIAAVPVAFEGWRTSTKDGIKFRLLWAPRAARNTLAGEK
jgi:hypothetical protein